MSDVMTRRRRLGIMCSMAIAAFACMPVLAAADYQPITPASPSKTVTLTGRDLTIEELVDVARLGAKVQLSPDAKQRQADNYGLLLEAAAEGVAVYWFNRGAGDQRETIMFSGDPLTPENRAYLEKTQLREFQRGAVAGYGPEVREEEIVRAMMVVRANAMTHNAPSPQLSQMLIDLLNRRITPVVQSRGTLGEGDLAQLSNVAAAMVGTGEVYYQGTRMAAADALAKASLKPIQPFAADTNALTSSDAYATGIAALAVNDAQRALQWADLIYAMELNGMNSSITPISTVVQRERPFKWLNWDAARVLDMLKGSYLFSDDPKRIIQDPESLRASSIRQASAWEEWAALRDAVLFQANSSDHNPAVNVGLSPQDSWELATPQLMRFFVKGGPHSHGLHGYIVSNANWDPYPMANRIESFVVALANMDIAVMLRIERFRSPFFTGVAVSDVLPDVSGGFFDYAPVDLQQEIQSLMNPIAPFGSAIVGTVEDLQAQTRLKAQRARQAVETTFDLLSFDLLQGSLWMDVRKTQDPKRSFGAAPTAAWTAFRQRMPLKESSAQGAVQFLKTTPAATFYRGGSAGP